MRYDRSSIMPPFFSLITVVLNDPAGLARTRRSIEEQEEEDWQHIIIDGGSRSESTDLLSQLSMKSKTVVVSESDQGIYDAMNKGFRLAAATSYVFFLNAGDRLSDAQALADVKDALITHGLPNWMQTTHIEETADGSTQYCKLVTSPNPYNQLYAYGYRSHQATLMKQSFLEQLGGFQVQFEVAADWDLMARAHFLEAPLDMRRPLAVFSLGGFSSHRMLVAHQELRRIRENYLLHRKTALILDSIWMSFALYDIGFRNIFSPSVPLLRGILLTRRQITVARQLIVRHLVHTKWLLLSLVNALRKWVNRIRLALILILAKLMRSSWFLLWSNWSRGRSAVSHYVLLPISTNLKRWNPKMHSSIGVRVRSMKSSHARIRNLLRIAFGRVRVGRKRSTFSIASRFHLSRWYMSRTRRERSFRNVYIHMHEALLSRLGAKSLYND